MCDYLLIALLSIEYILEVWHIQSELAKLLKALETRYIPVAVGNILYSRDSQSPLCIYLQVFAALFFSD